MCSIISGMHESILETLHCHFIGSASSPEPHTQNDTSGPSYFSSIIIMMNTAVLNAYAKRRQTCTYHVKKLCFQIPNIIDDGCNCV